MEDKPQVVDEPQLQKNQEKVDQKTEVDLKSTKKQHSYTYWVDDKNKSRELPEQHRPKKIDLPLKTENKPSGSGPSHWNTSGTWEQRAIPSKQLNETSREGLAGWMEESKCDLVLTQVALEGEFKRIFSNNKRKIMYELTGKIKFEGEDLCIKIEELTCSGDQQFSVRGKKKEQRDRLGPWASKIIKRVVQGFGQYRE